jgi:hypothetical protein
VTKSDPTGDENSKNSESNKHNLVEFTRNNSKTDVKHPINKQPKVKSSQVINSQD